MQPKLRLVDAQWVEYKGETVLLLQDRLGLSDRLILVPRALALLLSLCDGTRDTAGLRAAFTLRTGFPIDQATVDQFINQLDEALMLDSPRLAAAVEAAVGEFRAAPFRPPALAGPGYPAAAAELASSLESYAAGVALADDGALGAVRGLICPHIDFPRGGPTYAQVWARAREAVRAAELVILLGTDHAGGPGRLTLTRQSYATPFGVLPTAQDVVAAVASALGEEAAFAEELHHRREHSVELGAVWLHHTRGGEPCTLVPILCGSFQPFTAGEAHPRDDAGLEAALAALRQAMDGRRTLVVAAADLAHVGPAFGDTAPIGAMERAALGRADAQLLVAAAEADADGFLAELSQVGDRNRVCGLPPIYLALRLLVGTQGEVTGYAQCPADDQSTSVVSIAGVVLREEALSTDSATD